MTKNKIFFMILGALALIGIFYFVLQLNSGKTTVTTGSPGWALRVWILRDDAEKMKQYIEENFKKAYPKYAEQGIEVETFSDTYSYFVSLVSAFLAGNGPDIFMLQNTESSVFENQIVALDPEVLSPNDFRVRFYPVFWEDLIDADGVDLTREYVRGVPLGYEALGVYFNRRYFLQSSDMDTWENLLVEVKNVAEKYSEVIPLALGNGSSVLRSGDILIHLFALEGATGLFDLTWEHISQATALYSAFGDEDGENQYNDISLPFLGENDINLFTEWKVAAMIGYPRDLMTIDTIRYQKSFLLAHPFPQYAGKEKKTTIHYPYLVINKDSWKKELAQTFLAYLASGEGQKQIFTIFPYYIPAEISVGQEIAENKILPEYNIVYSNFIDPEATLLSFKVEDSFYFHKALRPILDLTSQQEQKIEKLKSFIICSNTKQTTLSNLSSPCIIEE